MRSGRSGRSGSSAGSVDPHKRRGPSRAEETGPWRDPVRSVGAAWRGSQVRFADTPKPPPGIGPGAVMLDLVRAGTTRALDLAFPGVCVGCGREGLPLCARCAPALDARIDEPPGVPIGLPGDIPEALLQVEWCASFRGTVRAALHAIKYGAEQRVAGPLGQAVARRWARVGAGGDLLVHVPVHADRRRVRGYDQAELIARSAAQALGLPHRSVLERHRATAAQFDLDRRDRASNVIGAFHVQPERGSGPDIRGRWVVLVDDVLTTGATLSACATALEAAGAMGVSAITVARER